MFYLFKLYVCSAKQALSLPPYIIRRKVLSSGLVQVSLAPEAIPYRIPDLPSA